jgi:hypothetical protein
MSEKYEERARTWFAQHADGEGPSYGDLASLLSEVANPAREELSFIVSYLAHNDQDANHAWMVRRIRAVLAGKDPRTVEPWNEADGVHQPRRSVLTETASSKRIADLRWKLATARGQVIYLRNRVNDTDDEIGADRVLKQTADDGGEWPSDERCEELRRCFSVTGGEDHG